MLMKYNQSFTTPINTTVPTFVLYSLQLHNTKSWEKPKTRDLWEFHEILRGGRETQIGAKWRKMREMFHQMFHHVSPRLVNGETFERLKKKFLKNNKL